MLLFLLRVSLSATLGFVGDSNTALGSFGLWIVLRWNIGSYLIPNVVLLLTSLALPLPSARVFPVLSVDVLTCLVSGGDQGEPGEGSAHPKLRATTDQAESAINRCGTV